MIADDAQDAGPIAGPIAGGAGEPFGTWLLTQVARKDWIGDLARAAKADRRFPRDGDPDTVRSHLGEQQAESDMLEAIDDAESIWLRL